MAALAYGTRTPLHRAEKAVLFADIVESARLVEADEEGTVARWLGLVADIREEILPQFDGRYIKGLGDGILVEFPDAQHAVAASFHIHDHAGRASEDVAPERRIALRIGIEDSDVIIENDDVYGRGVNRAARLLTLAGPGETIASAGVRDKLVEAIDGRIEDLGECFLKHLSEPVRAYRITRPGAPAAPGRPATLAELRPTIAVLPFAPLVASREQAIIGDVIAEEVIHKLSRSPEMMVISRLSTAALQARSFTVAEISAHLKADYVLGGSFRIGGDRMTIDTELSEARSGRIIWADKMVARADSLLAEDQETVDAIVAAVSSAVILHELRRARSRPLPTLQGYTLLLSAVALMHRLAPRDYAEARDLLVELIGRGDRQSMPHAWLANWHVLNVIQGWSQDLKGDAQEAQEHSSRALDVDPESSLALAIDGFVHTHLMKRFDIAEDRYVHALECNPSSSMAWLLKGTMHAFCDQGELAIEHTERALRLSPLDPHRFIYEAHCAGAYLSAGQWDKARELAESSLRANRCHTSTLRILTAALWELDRKDEARKHAAALRELEPALTVSSYLRRAPSADFEAGKRVARALRAAGIPD